MLLTAGDLDATFGSGGIVLTSPTIESQKNGYNLDVGLAVQVQPNGAVLAAGYNQAGAWGLVRLRPDGTLDPTFDSDGRVVTNFRNTPAVAAQQPAGIALQADGKIVVAGTVDNLIVNRKITTYNYDFGVVRYNENGSLDTTFGGSGKVTTDLSAYESTDASNHGDSVFAVAIQPNNGKIIVSGSSRNSSGLYRPAMVRYNADGSLDTTFGSGGKVYGDFVVASSTVGNAFRDLVALPDGKVLALGSQFVARYNPDGTMDTSFGPDATGVSRVILSTTAQARMNDVTVLADGSILAVGSRDNGSGNYDVILVRFTAAGVLDATFGGYGIITYDLGGSDVPHSLDVQAQDGKILVGCDRVAARFLPDGSLDPSYGSGGVANLQPAGVTGTLHAAALAPDGRFVLVGEQMTSDNGGRDKDYVVVRLKGDTSSLIASVASPSPAQQTLSVVQARPVLARALANWRARGANASALDHIDDIAIADLGGNRLGEASGSTITLDDNAAGWGWNVGRAAGRGRKAISGRMNLLAAMVHEVGHLLGREHFDGGVMAETLAPSVRQIPVERGRVVPVAVASPTPHRLLIEAFRGRGRRSRAAARA